MVVYLPTIALKKIELVRQAVSTAILEIRA